MGKSLVLAEKPSVAKEIAKVLGCRQNGQGCITGERYIVTWALGHLVTLADPESYNKEYKQWSLEQLPMLPKKMKLVVIKETSKQFNVVQSLLKRADITEIIIATDAGREGELVARWILMKAGCSKPMKRLWISSQTDKAVREGFKNLKPAADYYNLFLSAVSRAEADWLVGLNVTRALTCKHSAGLSAGRVQTPTLAMIVAREQEIKNFVPKEYYTVKAKFGSFSAVWMNGKGSSRMFDRAAAEAILQNIEGKQAVVTEINKQYKHKAPPAAYDLTELQRDANRKYAYSAKQTLSLMQSLYERHKLLTYPRTDSRYITDDIVATLPERLKSVAFGSYKEAASAILKNRPLSVKYLVDNSKVSDHHAIIPTEEPVYISNLTPEERNIYDLVVRRFFAVLSPAFEYEETKLAISAGKENFFAKGKIIKTPGWKSVYGQTFTDDDEDSNDNDMKEQALPQIRQGDKLDIKSCGIETGKTKPPARYNEATLLTAMENPGNTEMSSEMRSILKTTSGLGTPATRADIIEKLFSSFYIERSGKDILPTSKGMQLIDIVPPDLKSAELTGKWEQELSLISRGMAKSDKFVEQMRQYSSKLVSSVIASDAKYVHDNVTRQKCPECDKFLLEVKGKKGLMRICPDRECGYRESISVETNSRCPNCHKKLELRGEGEKRMFVCICGHRERLSDFEKRRAAAGANKNDVRKYMDSQNRQNMNPGQSALADQLAKWKEINKGD
ncbi:MAG: DNA topoisomerase III [Oscillospiraceae bacterium]|nr:DNA topoisomerase III [Oscillospiraceae bacterium]